MESLPMIDAVLAQKVQDLDEVKVKLVEVEAKFARASHELELKLGDLEDLAKERSDYEQSCRETFEASQKEIKELDKRIEDLDGLERRELLDRADLVTKDMVGNQEFILKIGSSGLKAYYPKPLIHIQLCNDFTYFVQAYGADLWVKCGKRRQVRIRQQRGRPLLMDGRPFQQDKWWNLDDGIFKFKVL